MPAELLAEPRLVPQAAEQRVLRGVEQTVPRAAEQRVQPAVEQWMRRGVRLVAEQ